MHNKDSEHIGSHSKVRLGFIVTIITLAIPVITWALSYLTSAAGVVSDITALKERVNYQQDKSDRLLDDVGHVKTDVARILGILEATHRPRK